MKPSKSSHKGNKSYLDSKLCAACGRPFSWRKKWQKTWHDVRYCSEQCRQQKPVKKGVEPCAI